MFHWNQVLELNNTLYGLLIKTGKETAIFLLSALLGSILLYPFLTPAPRNISRTSPPKLSDHTAQRYDNEGPDSPQGPFKSR